MQIYTPSTQIGNAIGQGLETLGRAFAQARITGPLREAQLATARSRALAADAQARHYQSQEEDQRYKTGILRNQQAALTTISDAVRTKQLDRETATATAIMALQHPERAGELVRTVLPSNPDMQNENDMRISAGQAGANPGPDVRYTAAGAQQLYDDKEARDLKKVQMQTQATLGAARERASADRYRADKAASSRPAPRPVLHDTAEGIWNPDKGDYERDKEGKVIPPKPSAAASRPEPRAKQPSTRDVLLLDSQLPAAVKSMTKGSELQPDALPNVRAMVLEDYMAGQGKKTIQQSMQDVLKSVPRWKTTKNWPWSTPQAEPDFGSSRLDALDEIPD